MKFLLCFLPVAALAFSVMDNEPSPPPLELRNQDPPPFEPEVVDEPENMDWMTMADLFEGDILLTEEQERQLNGIESEDRNIIKDTNYKWPNNEIPYIIDSNAGYSASQITTIENALATYSQRTNGCVKAVKRTNQKDYIKIINGEGCYSNVGRRGGMQELSLKQNGCIWTSTVVHEFLHAAGFWHEQSRDDRDDHVQIHLNNVKSGKEHNFNKHPLSYTQLIGDYDYASVMHYRDTAFSKNGQKTITRKDGGSTNFGNREGFTDEDVKKLMTLYQCSGEVTTAPTTAPTTASSCTNLNGNCDGWAARGYCTQKYVEYMTRECRKSCNLCTTTATTTTTASSCLNLNGNCDGWAARGYCTQKYVEYMTRECRKSCNLCTTTATTTTTATPCLNLNGNCDGWAARGYCTKNYVEYMTRQCRKSCNLC